MWITALLTALCICFIVEWPPSLANMVSTDGYYTVSDHNYKDTLPDDTISSKHFIRKFQIMADDPNSTAAVYECSRQCWKAIGCSSFLIDTSKRLCYLSRLNRCTWGSNFLYKKTGFNYYEILPSTTVNPPSTCFKTCIDQFECEKCGRQNCSGPSCTDCLYHCWDIPGNITGELKVWSPHLSSRIEISCNNGWEQLWPPVPGKKMRDTPKSAIKLMLVVIYKNGDTKTSYFDSVIANDNKLSVGEFETGMGNAGNFWEAPFQNRSISRFPNSTCYAFWYPPLMTSCEATGATEQVLLNTTSTFKKEGFAWNSSNDIFDNQVVTNIKLWMTKV